MARDNSFIPMVPQESDFDQEARHFNEERFPYGEAAGPVDELDHLAGVRARQIEKDSQSAQFVRTAPQSIYRATLGGSQTIISGQNPQQLIQWHGDDDAECSPMTITLAQPGAIPAGTSPDGTKIPPFPNPGPGPGVPGVIPYYLYQGFARVMWGTRGFVSQVDVDLNRGCQFTVGGSSVQVLAGLEPATRQFAPGAMQISAMLSFFPTQKFTKITRTLRIYDMDSVYANPVGGDVTMVIPNFAQSLATVSRSLPANPLNIRFLDPNLLILSDFTVQSGVEPGEIMIPNGAYYVEVINNAPVNNPQNVSLVFSLCL